MHMYSQRGTAGAPSVGIVGGCSGSTDCCSAQKPPPIPGSGHNACVKPSLLKRYPDSMTQGSNIAGACIGSHSPHKKEANMRICSSAHRCHHVMLLLCSREVSEELHQSTD